MHKCVCVRACMCTRVYILKSYGEDGSGTEALRVTKKTKNAGF